MSRYVCAAAAAFVLFSCTSTELSRDSDAESGTKRLRARSALGGIAERKIARERISREGTSTVVVLSVGAADGVKVGYRFTVYRGEEYVGKVEVIQVLDDMSYARVLADWTRKEIRADDDASTRVY